MPQCGLRELNRWCIFNRRIVTQSVFWGGRSPLWWSVVIIYRILTTKYRDFGGNFL